MKSTTGPETSPTTVLLQSRGPSSAKKRHLSAEPPETQLLAAAPCGPAGWSHQKAVCSEKLESPLSVTAWMELQRGVKGAVSWETVSCGVPTPQAAFAAHRDAFMATTCDVFCAGGWRGKMRHLESIHAAIASVNNPPLLDSSGLQVFLQGQTFPWFIFHCWLFAF